jgi:hypothetical protein
MFSKTIFSIFLLLFSGSLSAQETNAEKQDLFSTIYQLDSSFFSAFNKQDAVGFLAFVDTSLEFYHDKNGLTGFEYNKTVFMNNFKAGGDLNRQLVPGSLEVYPIPNYGAVQIAQHRFCHTENGKQDCGTFKFIHIWKQTGQSWKITRIISVDH